MAQVDWPALDERVTAAVSGWFRARLWLHRLAGWFSDLSSSVVILPLGALVWRIGGAFEPLGVRIVAGSLASSLATFVLKGVFRRRRPEGARGFYLGLDKHSFPSGHTLRAACFVWWLVPLWPATAPWAALLVGLWAVLVGICRVGAGAHHASDVVAGWVFGSLLGLLLLWLASPQMGILAAL